MLFVHCPPGRHECPPDPAFCIGRLVELLQIGEEATDVGHVHDSADNLGPTLEHAERAVTGWATGCEPSLNQREAGRHKPATVLLGPFQQVWMAEFRAKPGLVYFGIETDTNGSARHLGTKGGIVRGHQPGASDRNPD